GLLGRDVAYNKYGNSNTVFQAVASNRRGIFFVDTGHNLGGVFLKYWQNHGGLSEFGYPMTEEFKETDATGHTYIVQYFQRNRFEYHAEFSGTPYEVELGLLGNWGKTRSQIAQAHE